MTDTPEIERIRAALARYQAATTLTETLYAVGEFEDAACNSAAMTAVLAHIDAMQAEIGLLRADAVRYRWLRRALVKLSFSDGLIAALIKEQSELDAAMKGSTP